VGENSGTATDVSPLPAWRQIIAWIIVAGVAVRFSWTAVGLWMIRRHKLAASPLYPLPESITGVSARVNAQAQFCISADGIGPVTFGLFRPVVLLPASFSTLDADAQRSIACHELLHVRRRDWLMTLIEEVIAALFWFQPAFWWLLAQTRLAREQVVDAEVVRMTSAREPYIQALLAIAGARPALDVAPAPLFLRFFASVICCNACNCSLRRFPCRSSGCRFPMA
jgi:beta-lactamase regulating signal transducer with metallopeptidase domain